MLAIRMQRVGRKGYAQYRVVAQEARLSPKSGRVVANLGNYNPHTKTTTLDKEKVSQYLGNGAQPSDRVARLLKSEGVDLPAWVKFDTTDVKRTTRNPEKLRKNQPKEEKAEEVTAPAPTDEASAETEEKETAAEPEEPAAAEDSKES